MFFTAATVASYEKWPAFYSVSVICFCRLLISGILASHPDIGPGAHSPSVAPPVAPCLRRGSFFYKSPNVAPAALP